MKMVLAALVALVATAAQAHTNPMFTYEAAEAAYNSASIMSMAQVTAVSWMLVGKAAAPTKSHRDDFYSPDGLKPGLYGDGFYKEYLTFAAGVDAFGYPTQTAQETYYGAETGLLYKTYDYTFTVDTDAVNMLDITSNPKSLYSCRQTSNMMLCKVVFRDDCHGAHQGLYAGQAAIYLGYVAVP